MMTTRALSVLNRSFSGVQVFAVIKLASELELHVIRRTQLMDSVCAIRLRVFYKYAFYNKTG